MGPQHWWPGRTRLEIIVGAILTQNTGVDECGEGHPAPEGGPGPEPLPAARCGPKKTLAEWIRPAGYFNVKARRLRAFTQMMFDRLTATCGGSLR